MGGPAKCNWGITKTIGGRPQSPDPARTLGSLLARSAKVYLVIESVRLEKSILNIQAPNRPFFQGAQRYQLQLRRSATHGAGKVHVAIAQIPILISLRHQTRLNCFHAIHLLSGRHPSRIHQILGLSAHFRWWGNLELLLRL